MANAGATMPDMAGRRKKDEPPPPKPSRSPAYTVFARISPELGRAFDAYIEQTRPHPDKTAVIELALEKLFESAGLWPPAPPA